ncbi:hypothetical protein EJB05_14042, partial [Eragrostis curvula]
MAAPATELPDVLVEDVLFRIPTDDPTTLVRAALVCKQWRRLTSDPGLRRRYRELHGAPPMLGVLCNGIYVTCKARFVSTSSFRSRRAIKSDRHVVDARHGRVLLQYRNITFAVWDPIKDETWELPEIPFVDDGSPLRGCAAVLCAAAAGGCDHLHCQRGPFRVVFVADSARKGRTLVYIYSSEDGVWRNHKSSKQLRASTLFRDHDLVCSELIGNAVHFMFKDDTWKGATIIKYDLVTRVTSEIPTPPKPSNGLLMTTEDGNLGFASRWEGSNNKVILWSRQQAATSNAYDGWVPIRVIQLPTVLPANLVGFATGVRILFFTTRNGVYAMDLKSSKTKTICMNNGFYRVFPYTSFYPFY